MGKLKWLSCFVSSKRKEDSSDHSDDPANNPNSGDADGGVQGGDQRREGAKLFNFHELYTATNGFSQDCVIGRGGFGPVYKAQLGEQVVAIKQLNPDGAQGNREFMVEVLMLSLLEHPNLVKLVGYCAEGVQRLVVYEYMPMGSLDKHLYDRGPDQPPLDWKTRMKIAAGAARGLQHLHHEANPQIIFRDLKPSNILLDSDYTPKLSDFGLAKLGPVGDKTHVTTRVMGTYGYCAPEYAMTGHLTTRSDVFSYGVVLLEILTGRKAMDSARRGQREESLVAWARSRFRNPGNYLDMADPLLEERFPKRGFRQAIAVAAMCVGEHSRTRPLMTEVVTALTFLESQAEGNAPARPGIMIGEPSQGASNDSGSSSSGPQPQGTIVGSSSTAPELEGFRIGSPITTLGEGSSSRTGDEPRVLIVGLPDQPSGSESQPARGSVSRRPGKEPEITMAPDSDRQRAVAEAVVWAEGAWHGRRGE